jgi:hypothetical protein
VTTPNTPPTRRNKPAIDLRQWQSWRVFLTVIIGMAVALVCVYTIDLRHQVIAACIVGGATLAAWFLTGLLFRPRRR